MIGRATPDIGDLVTPWVYEVFLMRSYRPHAKNVNCPTGKPRQCFPGKPGNHNSVVGSAGMIADKPNPHHNHVINVEYNLSSQIVESDGSHSLSKLPIVNGFVDGKLVKVLRDTGCTCIIVRCDLIHTSQFTGDRRVLVLLDDSTEITCQYPRETSCTTWLDNTRHRFLPCTWNTWCERMHTRMSDAGSR